VDVTVPVVQRFTTFWKTPALTISSPIPRTRREVLLWLGVTLLFFIVAVMWTKTEPKSWNDMSRTAAIEAGVENGTWAIDQSPWLDLTQDKVFLKGHFYSGKMPLLSAIGAVWYAVLQKFGLSLAPNCTTIANGCAYYWVVLLLVGLPVSVAVGLFYLWGRFLNVSAPAALIGTLALGGTMLLPYTLVLNHHAPSAAMLFIAFYLLMVQAPHNPRWLLGTGLLATFAVMCDPLSGLMASALFFITLLRYRQGILYFILGALVPLLLTVWLDLQITGTILPPYLTPSAYAYPGSEFATSPLGGITADNLPQYIFKMFLGAQGLLMYNLTLLGAVAGLVIVLLKRDHPLRLEAVFIGLAFLGLCWYLAFRTGNLGGEAYGERWFVNGITLVMAFIYFAPPLAVTRLRPLFAVLFAVALALSLLSSWQGAKNAWAYVEPPFHFTRDAATGALGGKWSVNLNQLRFLKQ
jgi:hypothetical protein